MGVDGSSNLWAYLNTIFMRLDSIVISPPATLQLRHTMFSAEMEDFCTFVEGIS